MIETIKLNWSEAKLVETRRGPRNLRVAEPTPAFWGAWRAAKQQLQNEGVSCRKNFNDAWEVIQWSEVNNGSAEATALSQSSTVQNASTSDKTLGLNEQGSNPCTPSLSTTVWSDEQLAIFNDFATGTGNLVIGARAGTGKTTTIKHAFSMVPTLAQMLALGKSLIINGVTLDRDAEILYAVFNKKNQLEAQEKISDNRVEIKTLHSLGFFYIFQNWPGAKPDNSVERERIENVSEGIPDEVAGTVERLVGFAKNMLLAPTQENLEQLADDKGIFSSMEAPADGGWTVAKLAAVALKALEAAKERDSLNRISFNDMVWLPVVKNWVSARFDLVVVDEAQDMNLPQLEMAIRACRKDGRIVIVGDDRQAIYGFRGAAQDGMRMMQNRLQARVLGLTTTYRCPKSVVAIAAEIVPDYHAAPTAPEGEVSETTMEITLKTAVVGDAILSRLNAPLMCACLRLLKNGTPARIEGRDIGAQLVGMVRKLRAKSVPDFYRKLNTWGDKQRARLGATKNAASKIDQINDQVATLEAVAEGAANVAEIEAKLYSLFSDSDSNAKPAVVLSSVHKAKGLEWNRVFMLRGTFKRKNDEEQNIYYVAVTRAKKHLTFVD